MQSFRLRLEHSVYTNDRKETQSTVYIYICQQNTSTVILHLWLFPTWHVTIMWLILDIFRRLSYFKHEFSESKFVSVTYCTFPTSTVIGTSIFQATEQSRHVYTCSNFRIKTPRRCTYVVCPKSKCTEFLLNYLLDLPEIKSYLLRSMTLGKLHSGSNVSSTDHSSTGSHFP